MYRNKIKLKFKNWSRKIQISKCLIEKRWLENVNIVGEEYLINKNETSC